MKQIIDFILLEADDDFNIIDAVEALSLKEKDKLSKVCEQMLNRYGEKGDEKFIRYQVLMVLSLLD